MNHYDVIIIGGGPAGLTAGVYSSRAELKTLILEGTVQVGGQLTLTTTVENWPGASDGVNGPQLVVDMRKQAKKFGCVIKSESVTEVNFSSKPFVVTSDNSSYSSDAVIVATGASARMLGIDSESKLIGRGVSTCATCDGFFFKGKEIFVVGGGDSAMEEANFLTKFASKVTVIHRSDKLRASKIMQSRAKNNPKISFVYNSVVVEVLGVDDGKVIGVKVKDVNTNEIKELIGDGLFLAIGHVPNTDFIKSSGLEFDDNGYVVAKDHVLTNIEGVFVAGDVQDYYYRQAITASAMGCMSAIRTEKYLESLKK